MLLGHGPNKVFLVPDSVTERNINSIITDVTDDANCSSVKKNVDI